MGAIREQRKPQAACEAEAVLNRPDKCQHRVVGMCLEGRSRSRELVQGERNASNSRFAG
jgi:hypothetical protein